MAGLLSGCSSIGEKSASLVIVYWVTAILAVLLLIGYLCLIRPREKWFLLLFSAVSVINVGYLWLSLSTTLDSALWANRLSYLGSVLLPLSIMMIMLNLVKLRHRKWILSLLWILAIIVFLVAASPGYLDIYYREVSLIEVNGVSSLSKVYGPWHKLYLLYLLGYVAVMIVTTVHAAVTNKMESTVRAVILGIAVFVNVGVWLIEQLVQIDFELLSMSYIISELFLLGLHLVIQENEKLRKNQNNAVLQPAVPVEVHEIVPVPAKTTETVSVEGYDQYLSGLSTLTRTEHLIYDLYIAGKSTKEIMAELDIKENTLKFHNKNLYGKLGVSSRRQLLEIHRQIENISK